MKKLKFWHIAIIVLMMLVLVPFNSSFAFGQSSYDVNTLLKLSDQECLSVLCEQGLELPEAYQNDTVYTSQVVKQILSDYQNGIVNPDHILYNYTELVILAENIYETIGIASKDAKSLIVPSAYTLQDSTVIGTWSDSYLNYNCYGYAIGQTSNYVNPGYYSNKSFSMSLTISQMADLVVADLDSLGYWAISSTTKPSSLASYEQLICIRKGTVDYHFMRGNYTATVWNHKPGQTNPLNWKYTTPGYKVWTNEYSYQNVSYAGSTTYDSTVYYC